ncbi:MAG TPA: tyramine oxidase, partial [Gordonia polyisoprenivorans]|nr:tyramine oxidase [Gordonia polyisoprenivorans]
MSTAVTTAPEMIGQAGPDHPLTPLSAAEITTVRGIVDEAGLLSEHTRFVFVTLDEPAKDVVLAYRAGDEIVRQARVLLLDRVTGTGSSLLVSLTEAKVLER